MPELFNLFNVYFLFSISAIHVLLQPKEKPESVIKNLQAEKAPKQLSVKKLEFKQPIRPIHSFGNDYTMFSMFGYYPLITSDCFIHHHQHECYHHHGHQHHPDCHDHHHGGMNDNGIAICPSPIDPNDMGNFSPIDDGYSNGNGWLSSDIEGFDGSGVDGTLGGSGDDYALKHF